MEDYFCYNRRYNNPSKFHNYFAKCILIRCSMDESFSTSNNIYRPTSTLSKNLNKISVSKEIEESFPTLQNYFCYSRRYNDPSNNFIGGIIPLPSSSSIYQSHNYFSKSLVTCNIY